MSVALQRFQDHVGTPKAPLPTENGTYESGSPRCHDSKSAMARWTAEWSG